MKKLLRSLFGSSSAPGEEGRAPDSPVGARAGRGAPEGAEGLAAADVLAELQDYVRESLPDGLDGGEIEADVNMFDAGFVNSISGAELLAHIESRYDVRIAESELIGRLDNLGAIARHVASASS